MEGGGDAGHQAPPHHLMDQIRTLSDLQGAAALQAADPSLQAAYIAKLHQQAASIKNLLKLLNAGENNPGDLTALPNIGSFENVSESSSNNNVNLNFANIAQSGPEVNPEESVYESLWETGSLLKPRVNEVEELGEEEGRTSQVEEAGEESFYENTGIGNEATTVGIEVPPPLPPRLPSTLLTADSSFASASLPSLPSHTPSLTPLKQQSQQNGNTNEQERQEDCSTPLTCRQQLNLGLTSTPKEQRQEGEKLQRLTELRKRREDLIAELQSEERERQWHYTQLELISQKLRSLPLTSSLSVSTRACTNTSVPDMLQIIWCTMGEMHNCTRER